MIESEIRLLPGKEHSIKRGHPWVFSGALDKHEIKPGQWVRLLDHNGSFLATGYTDKGSLAFKLVGREEKSPEEYIVERLNEAYQLRKTLGILDRQDLDIYRLLFAEGDGLPGLIIDIYGKHAIIQLHVMALVPYLELISEELISLGFQTVYSKSRESLHDKSMSNKYLKGERLQDTFQENGIPFYVDWEGGQKTGFFIDQRENRQKVRALSKGRKVLNVYSYTGGFSSYALSGGATEVVSVDSSEKAIEVANAHAELLDASEKHIGLTQDALEYLKEMPSGFDVVILDPPAFVKSPKVRHKAVQAYKRINMLAMRNMASGSFLFTFSCSQHISRDLFVSTIRAAAIESKKSIRIIEHLQQPSDHPSSLLHPEGEYLKGLLLQMV